MAHTPDFLIIGGGIIGLAVARAIRKRYPGASITVLEKEPQVARHGSGRNSGVLHAGFYYTADSLKAKFCRDGNRAMRAYCEEYDLPVNPCRKLVVAADEAELAGLHELKRRGDANGVRVELIDAQAAEAIEPNVRTHEKALLSPDTVTVDPLLICAHLRDALEASGVRILTGHAYRGRESNAVRAGHDLFEAGMVINCAGLYADRIAQDFGFGGRYTIMPFKGVYIKCTGAPPVSTNIYPVPNLKNPFLGVHFTLTANGGVKIGPTAIPALWRENYAGLSGFNAVEMAEILRWQAGLWWHDAFGFRRLAWEEVQKYRKNHLISLAARMVKQINPDQFQTWSAPGIRAQLLEKQTLSLVQDFVVEGDARSVHVLNAVSPAFTCSLPFAEWVAEHWVGNAEKSA